MQRFKQSPDAFGSSHVRRIKRQTKSRTRSRAQRRIGRPFGVELLEPRQLLAAVIYDDGLEGPFQNWSWDTTVDFANTSVVQSGTRSLAVSHDAPWAGLYLRSVPGTTMVADEEIRFFMHGGTTGGQSFNVTLVESVGGSDQHTTLLTASPVANSWTEVVIDLPDPGAQPILDGLIFQDASGAGNDTFYLDGIEIGDFVPGETQEGPAITVDPATVVRQINDGIYGLNFADDALGKDIALPLNRWGGNSTTRYNYELDATNIASDYFFENYPSETVDVSTLPTGSTADYFVQADQANGSDTIMTIGTIGWTPSSRDIQGSFPVDVYGAQQEVDPWRPNFGNGIRPDGTFIENDPRITSHRVDETFATDWINHLTTQHGDAANGGVKYYALDNEPMLWHSTHRDVHPDPASYDEVRDRGVRYASAIKDADPNAQVLGPTVWGWTAYHYSALDAAAGGTWWNNPLDRNAHGGQAFLPWYLSEMAAAEAQGGTRLLDYLDIHYYPQTPNVALSSAGDAQTQADRLQSTRSLWDPTYVDDSWIDTEVQLIPRMRDWIDTHYPGTRLAITEYNFGGVEHINGAVTQADVLGIFGREGVDLATMWSPPDADAPAGFAFRMFRNYDGAGTANSRFGESSLAAGSTNDNDVSVFASRRSSDNALTLMLVNKSTRALTTPIDLTADLGDVLAEVYTYDASNLGAIVRGADLAFEDGIARLELAGSSIALIEIPSSAIRGDFDMDGVVGVPDVDLLCAAISSGVNQSAFDLTGDGSIGQTDMDEMILEVIGTLYGDANLDGRVDGLDFHAWNSNQFTFTSSWGAGDFSCDGAVDVTDFNVWNTYKFSSAAVAAAFSAPAFGLSGLASGKAVGDDAGVIVGTWQVSDRSAVRPFAGHRSAIVAGSLFEKVGLTSSASFTPDRPGASWQLAQSPAPRTRNLAAVAGLWFSRLADRRFLEPATDVYRTALPLLGPVDSAAGMDDELPTNPSEEKRWPFRVLAISSRMRNSPRT